MLSGRSPSRALRQAGKHLVHVVEVPGLTRCLELQPRSLQTRTHPAAGRRCAVDSGRKVRRHDLWGPSWHRELYAVTWTPRSDRKSGRRAKRRLHATEAPTTLSASQVEWRTWRGPRWPDPCRPRLQASTRPASSAPLRPGLGTPPRGPPAARRPAGAALHALRPGGTGSGPVKSGGGGVVGPHVVPLLSDLLESGRGQRTAGSARRHSPRAGTIATSRPGDQGACLPVAPG